MTREAFVKYALYLKIVLEMPGFLATGSLNYVFFLLLLTACLLKYLLHALLLDAYPLLTHLLLDLLAMGLLEVPCCLSVVQFEFRPRGSVLAYLGR